MSRTLNDFIGGLILFGAILLAQIIAAAPGLASSTSLGKIVYIQSGDI